MSALPIASLQELARACRDDMIAYSCFVDPNYQPNRFHSFIASRLAPALARGRGRFLIEAPPQIGKQVADDTPVLTANRGWAIHGGLRAGDFVFGVDGKPTEVLAVAAPLPQDCEVELTDGTIIRCHENHEWTVYDRGAKKWKTMETGEFMRPNRRGKVPALMPGRGKRGSKSRYMLPLRQSLQAADADLPVDPYTLGAWLGDGSVGKPVLSMAAEDRPVVEAIGAIYPKSAVWVHKDTGVVTTSFAGGPNRAGALTRALDAAGVRHSKHIPDCYLTASEAQRMQLMAGLIDTDGHVHQPDQRVSYATTNTALCEGVAALVRSLGWRATISATDPVLSSSGIQGRLVVYNVTFTPDRPIPTLLERRRVVGRPNCQRKLGIAAVRRGEVTTGRCIQVAAADGLYLVGRELIPTHNSEIISRKLPAYALGRYAHSKIIAASYGEELSLFNGGAVRDIVASPPHRMVFPEAVIVPGSTAKDYFETANGGRYLGTTVRGGATGFGSSIFIIDDALKDRAEADSLTVKKAVWDWFKSVCYTRLAENSVLIVMATRWALDDLSGRCLDELKHEEWEVIRLPAVAEEGDIMGRVPGEALVPERFSKAAYDRIKMTLGGGDARDWLALYQQRPIAEGGGEFKEGWLQYYTNADGGRGMTKVILVDPAGERRADRDNDYTAIWVVGLGADHNYYVLDLVRDRLNLEQRADAVFRLHRKWRPTHPVRYEQYGLQADIEHIRSRMERDQYRFKVIPVGGATRKNDRIRRLIPLFSQGQIYMPNQLWYTNSAGELVDLIAQFREEEYKSFPVGRHDDALDALARLCEPNEKRDPNLELHWPDGNDRWAPVIEAPVVLDPACAY